MADIEDNARKGKSYEELMASAKERAAKAQKSSKANDVVQLPIWPEPTRGVPNGVLRSALFGAVRKGARRYMEGEKVASVDGVVIRYTGQRLDQCDLDVWESVLHLTRTQEMGEQCHFTAYALLKMMGKADTGSNRDGLYKNLMRLKANAVEVQQERYSYAGSLIDDVYRDKETHEYVLAVNPKLHPLFSSDQFTQIEWVTRLELSGQPLAQWLHGFYSSHAKPYPMRIDTLLELSGSENSSQTSARQKFRKAMDAVAKACKANGQGFSYEIINNLVYVKKEASEAQKRHLAKRLNRPKKPGI
jgi:hypothetical protein